MNNTKIYKYINKLNKIKYNISNSKYDIYSKKISYYMTGGAVTNSQLMTLIVMYLIITNPSNATSLLSNLPKPPQPPQNTNTSLQNDAQNLFNSLNSTMT